MKVSRRFAALVQERPVEREIEFQDTEVPEVLLDALDGENLLLEGLAAEGLLPLAELSLEALWILLLEEVVVLLDVNAENVLKVLLLVEVGLGLFLLFDTTSLLLANSNLRLDPAETWEALVVVRDV